MAADDAVRENVFAFTEPSGAFPGYVSVNRRHGGIEVTARTRNGETGACVLSREQAHELGRSLLDL